MIELDRHIEILLLNNDCVIVPGFGGFMAHHVESRYDEAEETFLPPLRTLGFNPALTMNDSLLVQSYIEAYDISYPEALRRIEAEVDELRQHIEQSGQYEMNDIGTLRLNDEGRLLFEPCEAGILTPQFYGLASFEMQRLAARPKAVATTEDEADGKAAVVTLPAAEKSPQEGTIVIKMSWLRNVACVAAAVIAFLMIGTPVSNSSLGTDIQQSALIPISSSHHTAKPSLTAPEAEPTTTVEPAESAEPAEPEAATPRFCIVLASQVSMRNAQTFIEKLGAEGYAEARIMQTKMLRVVYGSYASEAEAYNNLRTLRADNRSFGDAWVMRIDQ